MSFSGHHRTPPRSLLVIVGGVIASAGLILGIFVTVPQYHHALTMKPEPVEMTWHQLVEQGLTDNTHVRLIDVQLEQDNPMGLFADMFKQIDPEAAPQAQQAAFESAMDDFDVGKIAETILQPIKVYPKGEDAKNVPVRIVVPASQWATEEAYQQIEETGALTGRFSRSNGNAMEMKLAKLLLTGFDQNMDPAVKKDSTAPANDNVEAPDSQTKKQAGGEFSAPHEANSPIWVFEPIRNVPNASASQQLFWLSGFAAAIGLVICGAGGPSISCCVFFQGPAILSMFGYPMRYGRAGKTTRVLYTGIGIGLVAYGYQKMIVEGRLGHVDGDITLSALGFVAGSFGAAAMLGSFSNSLVQRLSISLDPKPEKKVAEQKVSFTDACSLEPTEKDLTTHFVDERLVNDYSATLPEEMQTVATSLEEIGFSSPEPVVWFNENQSHHALIQLGCQQMVVADIDEVGGERRMRMVSVLHDGLAIVTLSPYLKSQKPLRLGTNGLYLICPSDDPIEILSTHLEQTVSLAEKRKTSVVSIEVKEITDVVVFARRVLADVRAQYGEEYLEMGEATYGRFVFPVAAIPQQASCAVLS